MMKLCYGEGGEFKATIIQRFLKSIARSTKRKYAEFHDIYKKYTKCGAPVVLEFRIPISYIVNQKHIGKGNTELYTIEKVPMKYLVTVHY